MAFLDFSTSIGFSTFAGFVGGNDGSQQINAALTNPLLLQGADCRRFFPAPNVANDGRHHVNFKPDSVLHPSFTSIPDTQAISVRAWVRKDLENGAENANVHSCVYLNAKGNTTAGSNNVNGYVLSYGRDTGGAIAGGNYGSLNLRIRGDSVAVASTYFDVPNIVDLPRDTWHNIRLDVIPTKNGAVVDRDTVRVYTSTLANEANPVWTLQHEEVFLLAETYAASWGVPSTSVGFGANTTSDLVPAFNKATYIDGFDARLVVV